MTYFVLAYDRGLRRVLDLSEFTAGDRRQALDCRARLAAVHPSAEVVVLSAASQADLRQTHGRYFESVGELLSGELV